MEKSTITTTKILPFSLRNSAYVCLLNLVLILDTAEPPRFVGLRCFGQEPLTSKSLSGLPWESRMADVLLSLRGLESLSPAMSLQHHTRRGKLAEWHHGATHEYHVNVGSEPALGFTALTPTPSYFLHVRVSLFMCVWFFSPSPLHVCVWCRMAGESRTTHFFMLPLLFIPPLLLSFYPSGFSEQPSDFLRLWWRPSDTLYIMACAMLKGLITLTLISLQ